MRKYTWKIVLFQKKIPDGIQQAFPHVAPPCTWMNGTYVVQPVTYDPITNDQLALLKRSALPLASDCIHSVSCSSEDVQENEQPESAVEEASEDDHLYSFTLRGHVVVTETHGEEIAYGWTKTALENLTLDLPENLQQQVKSFAIVFDNLEYARFLPKNVASHVRYLIHCFQRMRGGVARLDEPFLTIRHWHVFRVRMLEPLAHFKLLKTRHQQRGSHA